MPTSATVAPAFLASLCDAVGGSHVLTDTDVRAGYERDWTGRFGGRALAVVRPGDTDQVAAVVTACAEAGVSIVPQGGRTSFVGGGVPRGGEVLLSLTRLTTVEQIDPAARQVVVGAGVTLAGVQAAGRAARMELPLDLGARDTATIGGILATNAGGNRAFRHGTARALTAGVEAVLPDGSRMTRLSGLVKDNAGYDLPGLLVGSEGTLGVITRARLRLTPVRGGAAAALIGLPCAQEAVDLGIALRHALPGLEALELFFAAGMRLVADAAPFMAPAYLLVELRGGEDPALSLAETLSDLTANADAVLADDAVSRERLWRLREAHTEAVAPHRPLKLDVAVPLPAVGAFLSDLAELLDGRAQPIVYGHAGDGNLHLNLIGHAPVQEPALTDEVLGLVVSHEGSIGAEHGIGMAKRAYLRLARSPVDLAAQRAIKLALDPREIMNPGVLEAR